jgi:hypothetical protein
VIDFIRVLEWESRAALHEHLDSRGKRTLLLGLDAESPRRFYSASLGVDEAGIELGLYASGLGPLPAVVTFDGGRRALVGHDARLTWVDLSGATVRRRHELGGAFFEFLSLDRDDQIVVVHELGAVCVDSSGGVVWNVDTPDVVEDSRIDAEGNLVLSIMDRDSPIVVSLKSGRL